MASHDCIVLILSVFECICMYFQTAETVESIVTQLMEKQRCAKAAALSGKALDCPSCNDPNQECSLHHVPGMLYFCYQIQICKGKGIYVIKFWFFVNFCQNISREMAPQ